MQLSTGFRRQLVATNAVRGLSTAVLTKANTLFSQPTTALSAALNVNVVLPGWISTPGELKWSTHEAMAELAPRMPWGRLGTPDDIGAAIGFLCSDAADYITGSELVVDGGYSVSQRLPMVGTTG